MRTGRLIFQLLFLTALLAGCREQYTQEPVQKADLLLQFSTPVEASLETKGIEDGESFHNLLVLVMRGNTVLHKKTWPEDISNNYVSKVTISIPDVELGSYDVYAYANYDETAWQQVYISGTELIAPIGSTLNVQDRLLKGLSSSYPAPQPPAANTPMLLTGHSQVSVGVVNNVAELKLLRPVARLNLYINNHTPYPVRLDELAFNNFFAPQSYLIGRTDSEGQPQMPSGTVLETLPAYNTSNPITIGSMEVRKCVYSILMYEMTMPSNQLCRMYAKATLIKAPGSTLTQTLGTATEGVPLKKIDNETSLATYLTAITRNQELNIEVNVFYETVAGQVEFWLENLYWSVNGHVSEHTYN